MSNKSWRDKFGRRRSEAKGIIEQFSYELAPRDWIFILLLFVTCLGYIFVNRDQLQTAFVGAISSLTVYLLGLLLQSRKNVEGPRQPIEYLQYPEEIRNAKSKVFVYTTFLRSLCCESKHPDERKSWLEALRAASQRRQPPEIKFSFLDPDPENLVARRAVEIRQDDLNEWADEADESRIDVEKMIKQNLWTLYCLSRYEGFVNIVVCKYSRTPILSILQADAAYSIAPYELRPLHLTDRFNAHEDSSLGKFIQRIVEDIDSDTCSAAGDKNALEWFDEVWLAFQNPAAQSLEYVERAFPYVVISPTERNKLTHKIGYAAWIEHHESKEYYDKCKKDHRIFPYRVIACSKRGQFDRQTLHQGAVGPVPDLELSDLKTEFIRKYGVDVAIDGYLSLGPL